MTKQLLIEPSVTVFGRQRDVILDLFHSCYRLCIIPLHGLSIIHGFLNLVYGCQEGALDGLLGFEPDATTK